MRDAGLSLEMWKFAKAECVPVHEGSTCVIVTRDDVASPGSKAASRMESIHWNKQPPAPGLPADVANKTSEKYKQAYRQLTNRELPN